MMKDFGNMTTGEMETLRNTLRIPVPITTPFDILCRAACQFAIMTLDRMIAEKLGPQDRGS